MRLRLSLRPSRIVALALLTLSCVALSTAVAASPAKAGNVDGVVGMYVGRTTNTSFWQGSLRYLAPANLRTIRVLLPWANVETSRGVYSWAGPDAVVTKAAASGLKVEFAVQDTPGWAQSGTDDVHRGPDDPARLTAFLKVFTARYKGKLAAMQVWNEPNAFTFFQPYVGMTLPQSYVRILKAAYAGVKAGDPALAVEAGNTDGRYATNSTGLAQDDFLRACYDAGAKGFFDIWATHNYPGFPSTRVPEFKFGSWAGGRSVWGVVGTLRSVLDANGDTGKKLAISEVGWLHAGTAATSSDSPTLTTQARYTVRHVLHAFRYGVASYQIMFVKDVTGNPKGMFTDTYAPNRAFTGVKTALTTLKGTAYLDRLATTTSTYAYRFRRVADGRAVIAAWSVSGEYIDQSGSRATGGKTVTLPLTPGTRYTIVSMTGVTLGTLDAGSAITLGNDPVYLVQQ